MGPSVLQENRALPGSEERTDLQDVKGRRDPQVRRAAQERRETPGRTVLRSENVLC